MYSDYSLIHEFADCTSCEIKQAQHNSDIVNTFRLIPKQIMTSTYTNMPAKHLRLKQRMQKDLELCHHVSTKQ